MTTKTKLSIIRKSGKAITALNEIQALMSEMTDWGKSHNSFSGLSEIISKA